MTIELLRMWIPVKQLISDNSGTHYKAHQGKLQWLSRKTREILERNEQNFDKIYTSEEIRKIADSGDGKIFLVFEIWKQSNIAFDVFNFTKTYKASVDVFTNLGYWEDDNWNFIPAAIMSGGGPKNWGYAYEGTNAKLPVLMKDIWEGDPKDAMIRILLIKN